MTRTAPPDSPSSGGATQPKRSFVLLMAAFMALSALSVDLILPSFADIRHDFGLASDSSATGQLVTVFFAGLGVGQVVYGPLSDRYGRKPLIYAGLAFYVSGALLASFAPTFALLVVCRFIWGFGAAAPRSMTLAMVRDTLHGDHMARVMSNIMGVFLLVPIFAPALGAALVHVGPWQAVFWFPAICAIALGLWLSRAPETLAPENRRPVNPRALGNAFGAVVTTRVTLALMITVTLCYGVMTSFVSSVELIIDDMYDERALFPLVFAFIGILLGAASLSNARIVMSMGLRRLLRASACYIVVASCTFALLVFASGGKPPMWVFLPAVALLMAGVVTLVPNGNTAAIAPLPHVAGMAAAVIGAISTLGGSMIGSVVAALYNGSLRPFALAAIVCSTLAALGILAAGRPAARVPPDLDWVEKEPPVAP